MIIMGPLLFAVFVLKVYLGCKIQSRIPSYLQCYLTYCIWEIIDCIKSLGDLESLVIDWMSTNKLKLITDEIEVGNSQV